MEKIAFFFIDDVIWVFRDIARQKPKSLFDTPFMKMLKTAHDNYGMKTQLNIFFKTDNFYGKLIAYHCQKKKGFTGKEKLKTLKIT